MIWKAHFYDKGEAAKEVPENYGFKSLICLQEIKELSAFEHELFNLLNIFNRNHIQKRKQKNRKTNQLRREKYRKIQNYCKQNPCERPPRMFYTCKTTNQTSRAIQKQDLSTQRRTK